MFVCVCVCVCVAVPFRSADTTTRAGMLRLHADRTLNLSVIATANISASTTVKQMDCLKTCEKPAPRTCAEWYGTFFTVGGCGLTCPPRTKRKTQPNTSCEFSVQVGDRVFVKSSSLQGCVAKVDKKTGEVVVAVVEKRVVSQKKYLMGEILLVKASDKTCTTAKPVATTAKNKPLTTLAAKTSVIAKNTVRKYCMIKNGNCDTHGHDPLPSGAACVAAAAELGHSFKSAFAIKNDDRPPGCYIDDSRKHNRLRFNWATSNKTLDVVSSNAGFCTCNIVTSTLQIQYLDFTCAYGEGLFV